MKENFNDATFVKSAVDKKGFLFDHPTVTFIGRSNVGKSTLVNALVKRKNFMKTSKTAGLTNMVNYALIAKEFYIADVPGYGFAKFKRDTFAGLMKDFLEENPGLKKVYILIDARRLLLPDDEEFAQYLDSINIEYSFVFTKVDKISASEKHFLQLQKEKLGDHKCFEVGFKKESLYQALREDIVRSIK